MLTFFKVYKRSQAYFGSFSLYCFVFLYIVHLFEITARARDAIRSFLCVSARQQIRLGPYRMLCEQFMGRKIQ